MPSLIPWFAGILFGLGLSQLWIVGMTRRTGEARVGLAGMITCLALGAYPALAGPGQPRPLVLAVAAAAVGLWTGMTHPRPGRPGRWRVAPDLAGVGVLATLAALAAGGMAVWHWAWLGFLPCLGLAWPLSIAIRAAARGRPLAGWLAAILATVLLAGIADSVAAVLQAGWPAFLPPSLVGLGAVVSLEAFRRGVRTGLAREASRRRLLGEVQELRRINAGYGRFIPAQFLKHLGHGTIATVRLGDQVERTMTVLFTDIRNFTSFSEKLTPQENFNFLNAFLKRVGPVIRRHNGFIDKYIGDAIMALFDGTVDEALAAAIDMQVTTVAFNAERATRNLAPVSIGIGLHRGPLMLGIIGEEGRMESTVISDTVNLASRIESLTKRYDCKILVSRPTFEKQTAPEAYSTRPVDLVRVKGKNQTVELLEILDHRIDPHAARKIELAAELAMAIGYFREGQLEQARNAFQVLAYTDPADSLYRVFRERVEALIRQDLPDDWDGSAALDSK